MVVFEAAIQQILQMELISACMNSAGFSDLHDLTRAEADQSRTPVRRSSAYDESNNNASHAVAAGSSSIWRKLNEPTSAQAFEVGRKIALRSLCVERVITSNHRVVADGGLCLATTGPNSPAWRLSSAALSNNVQQVRESWTWSARS
jgi:hypothetical protein